MRKSEWMKTPYAMIVQADAWQLPFQDKSIDSIITSPPYFGCDDYEITDDFVELGTENNVNSYIYNLAQALTESNRVLKDDGTMWLILGDLDDQIPINMVPQRVAVLLSNHGWIIVQEITWVKNYRVPGRIRVYSHPESKTEKVYMLAKNMDYKYYTDFARGNCWEISPARYTAGKWAVLPDELIKRCLECSTVPGDIVLDPFSGSGAVPRFANLFGRIGIGSDINPT